MMQSNARMSVARSETSASPVDGAGFQVLARLPRLAVAKVEVWKEPPQAAPWGRRLLSQSLSKKLLLCAGVLLVLAAIVPFLMNTKSAKHNPGILPTPDQFQAAATKTDAASTRSGLTPSMPAPLATTAVDRQGKPPTAEKTGVPSVNELLGKDTSSAMPTASPWPAVPRSDEAVTRAMPAPSARLDGPAPGTPSNPEIYGAGMPNRAMSLGRGPTETPSGYPADSLADRRMPPPPSPATAQQAGPYEPGVARFEGTIEKPSVRTTYDRPRSSVY